MIPSRQRLPRRLSRISRCIKLTVACQPVRSTLKLKFALALEEYLATRGDDRDPTARVDTATHCRAKELNREQVEALVTLGLANDVRGSVWLLADVHPPRRHLVLARLVLRRVRRGDLVWLLAVHILLLPRGWDQLFGADCLQPCVI